MQIERLSPNQLQAQLTAGELAFQGLDYLSLGYNDPATRRLLRQVLLAAHRQMGFDLTGNGQLLVEASPTSGGGCRLLITRVPGRPPRYRVRPPVLTPLLFSFATGRDLAAGCAAAFSRCSHRIRQSSLYRWREEYCLLLTTLERPGGRLSLLFSEFGRPVGQGTVAAAFLAEHGRLLIGENAIDQLAYYFR